METEVHLALAEIRDLLRKRRYKAAVAKTERILDSTTEIQAYAPEDLFRLLILEASAVNKLLTRNLLKKYKYDVKVVDDLIRMLVRNLSEVHDLLSDLLQEAGEVTVGQFKPTDPPSFSLTGAREITGRIKMEKLEPVFRSEKVSQTRKYVEQFMTMVNVSLLNFVQMALLYRKDVSWRGVEKWAEIPGKAFVSPAGRLSKAKTQLVVGRLLSLDGSNQLVKAQTVLDESTEQLIDCLHLANCLSFSTRDSELQCRRHRQMQRECYKLLMITLIMTNKNHMKLGHEEAAAMGCDIIKASVSGLGQGFAFFKRLLQPEVYLLDQYKRYRAEKKELVEVATWYFGDLVAKVEGEKEEEQLFRKKERRVEGERGTRISDQWAERGSDEISTVKTISTGGKRKGNSSLLNCRNPSYDGMQSRHIGDTIITKMIISHVEELNRGYTGLRNQIGAGSYYKAIQGKHISSQKPIPRTLKKQRLTQQVISNSPEPDSQRTARLQLEEARGRKEAKEAKARLERRGKTPLRNLIRAEDVVEPAICQLEREIDNGRHMLEMRDSESGSFSQDEAEVKCGNMRTKKTKVFIEILFLNREGLGIKKLVEKFELLKKKDEQKQKMISIRAANSDGRDKGQRLFKVIAGEILKMHLGKKGSHSDVRGTDSGDKSRMVQASHALGQDSIQAIRAKLADKMDRQERVCDKSQLSEEVFKAKLKRLGSSNFFLKRVGDGKTEMKVKRASIGTTRTSKVKFWDPIEEC